MSILRGAVTAVLAGVLVVSPGFVAAAAGPDATHQETDVLADDLETTVGEASLVRNDNGIRTRARVSDVEPGVYTLWWVIWNAPENCETPYSCTGKADLFKPEVEVAIGFGDGQVVESDGELDLAASLDEGEELTGFPDEFGVPTVEAMTDARHAEVHLVARSHGPKIPEKVNDMLHTFNGGCVYEEPIEGTEPKYGEAGPNTCEDLYFAVFDSEDAP